MKKMLNASFLMLGMVILISCQSDIKAVTHYTHSPSGGFSYFLNSDIRIDLKKDGAIIATQYATGSTTLDLGNFGYGQYSIRATADEYKTNGFSTGPNAFLDKTVEFDVHSTTTTVNINLP